MIVPERWAIIHGSTARTNRIVPVRFVSIGETIPDAGSRRSRKSITPTPALVTIRSRRGEGQVGAREAATAVRDGVLDLGRAADVEGTVEKEQVRMRPLQLGLELGQPIDIAAAEEQVESAGGQCPGGRPSPTG